jgi:hypothetical protein
MIAILPETDTGEGFLECKEQSTVLEHQLTHGIDAGEQAATGRERPLWGAGEKPK